MEHTNDCVKETGVAGLEAKTKSEKSRDEKTLMEHLVSRSNRGVYLALLTQVRADGVQVRQQPKGSLAG
jgi:hypothetical protein